MANAQQNAAARHQLYVERLAATNANTIDPELKALAAYLRSRLSEEGGSITSIRAMNAVVRDVRKRFGSTYDKWAAQTGDFVNDLTKYETAFQTGALNVATTDDFTPKKPTNKSSRTDVINTPLMIGANGGAVNEKDLIGNFSKTETDKVESLIKTGYFQGRTTAAIIGSIVGTKANNYKDGVMVGTKRKATAISKTSAVHASTITKDNVWKSNEGAVQGYIVTAVLDSSTSKICRGLDNLHVRWGDSFQPRPPMHFSCRSTTIPWLRDDLDAVNNPQRETKGADGKEYEPTAKQYYPWLKQQPAWFQDDVLGKTEGKIFRNAGLTPEQFRAATIKQDGTPLNISEMAAKDSQIMDYLKNE